MKIIIPLIVVIILISMTLFADSFAPNDPYKTDSEAIRTAPCSEYIFGTDNLGRCVFSRVLYGGRTTILATFFLVFISFVIGSFIGMLCGYYGGIIDEIFMRIADIFLAFPQMVLAIAVAGILGGGMTNAMLSLGITMWVSFARLSRSHTSYIKNEPFIIASKFAGKSDFYIIFVHILPNLVAPVFTNALTQIGTTMMGLSGLSFLGLGVTPPEAEWGEMLNEGRAYIQIAPWIVFFPAAAIILTIVVFNYIGDIVMEHFTGDEK